MRVAVQRHPLCPAAAEPGLARHGGYAEAVVVPSPRFLVPRGDLDPVRAAPLADAGVTPYRAVRRSAPRPHPLTIGPHSVRPTAH